MKYCFGLILTLFVITACEKEAEESPISTSEEQVLNSLSLHIEKQYSNFKVLSQDFYNQLPETKEGYTTTKIVELQESYSALISAYHTVEPYILGQVLNDYVHVQINSWPYDSTVITNQVSNTNEFSVSDFDKLSNSSIGLPAIEFVLYEHSDSLISSGEHRSYFALLATSLAINANRLNDSWINYAAQFKNNDLERRQNPINLLVNQVVVNIEHIKNNKVAAPYQINNYSGPFEYPHSQLSLTAIKQNVNELSAICLGENSLNTLLRERGQIELADNLVDSFSKIEDLLESLGSFDQQENSNIESLEILFADFTNLEKLYKYQVSDALNTTIYVSSEDGD